MITYKTQLQLINNNIEDYFEIDNFIEKIDTRAEYLSKLKQPNENHLKQINQETLDACERCLWAVNWTKYK